MGWDRDGPARHSGLGKLRAQFCFVNVFIEKLDKGAERAYLQGEGAEERWILRWDERFLASTRGRIIALLRRSEGTVNDLAAALELSDNAVRAHLASLERDGLVEQRGVRRGVGKPAYIYGLTAESSALFPKAYDRVISGVLSLLAERHGVEEVESLLEEVGRRVVADRSLSGDMEARIASALTLLEEMGGLADVEERNGSWAICGYSCPFGELVPSHPEICRLAESVLTEVLGVAVRERCEKGSRPRCVFEVEGGGGGG